MADLQSDNGMRKSNTALLQKLASAVKGHAATATFACGGSVPLSDLSTGNLGSGAQDISPSITVRWDSEDHDIKQSRIDFPLPVHDDVSRRMLSDLLRYCQPATFGVDGRDVLDEKYRKAAKLDTSEFSTNFHPHDCGILDSIQQILLPSTIRGAQGIGIGPQGVRAELYKLNIYSAPSGKFMSHVDTPRGVMQFGSLVVCLPCQHEGGVLRVKHRGQEIDFAWGHTSQQSVQWAAFYGDCEHEVLEVTKGHRITLTYNLNYSSIGELAQPVSAPRHLPLFDIAREMLLEQSFMRKGGIVGFFCHHQYAHSQDSGRKSIPGAFKGVDLAIFSVFQALGLKIGIHPIIQNRSDILGGLSAKDLMQGLTVPGKVDFVEDCLEKLSGIPEHLRGNRKEGDVQMLYEEDDAVADDDTYSTDEEVEEEGTNYYHSLSYSYPNGEREETTTLVGTKLHGPTFDESYEEESLEPVTDAWPHKKVPQIIWMNEPMHKDFAHAGLKYGNEASLNYQFSAAAILVVVPPSEHRATPSHARRTSTAPRPTRDDKPLHAAPSAVIATPASSMSADDVPNAPPGTVNVVPGPSSGLLGASCSSFDATSRSLWDGKVEFSSSEFW